MRTIPAGPTKHITHSTQRIDDNLMRTRRFDPVFRIEVLTDDGMDVIYAHSLEVKGTVRSLYQPNLGVVRMVTTDEVVLDKAPDAEPSAESEPAQKKSTKKTASKKEVTNG